MKRAAVPIQGNKQDFVKRNWYQEILYNDGVQESRRKLDEKIENVNKTQEPRSFCPIVDRLCTQ